ncbi:hypothetical protein Mpe_B0010 (plasmid) [Methylibium petroleiphilum PM1]|uniref:Uncharacterized protein n=1 Tax=Methylibium petroleiphilum (strain ATCC BAA-1232 / LMG 22953 / PM1) TaxID=420662 RepID=A2SMK2_METPP|nr:hypothetical protein Mpe_B0010 [Methylibium petroleiphilum PM1]
MLSTLLSAAVPAEDAELLQRLTEELDRFKGDGTDTVFRFAVANQAGELYRMVLVFGFYKRTRALELMQELGYHDGGPRPDRQLDAVFLLTQQAHVE